MGFVHYDLGQASASDVVEVSIDCAANLLLLDSTNFQRYRNGNQHTYYGGHYTQTPVRIKVPHSGHWHIAIDFGGLGGNIRSSARVLSR